MAEQLFDWLNPQPEPQKRKPKTGLFDFFGGSGLGADGYDLGSRLMMAGAHLEGNPQAAAAIRRGMLERREERARQRQLQALADAMIAKRPELAEVLQADPSLASFYMKAEAEDEYSRRENMRQEEVAAEVRRIQRQQQEADTLRQRGWTVEDRELARDRAVEDLMRQRGWAVNDSNLARARTLIDQQSGWDREDTKEAKKPENVFRGNFMDALGNRTEQMEDRMQAPGAGIQPGTLSMSDYAMRAQSGIRDLTADEAQQLTAAAMASPQEYSQALSRIKADRLAQKKFEQGSEGFSMTLPDGTQVQLGGSPGSGGAGGLRQTDAQRRDVKLADALEGLDVKWNEFADLAGVKNTIGQTMQGFDNPFGRLAGRAMMSDQAQKAYNGITGVAQLYIFSLSGMTATEKEVARILNNVMPDATAGEGAMRDKWLRLNQMATMLKEGAGVDRREFNRRFMEWAAANPGANQRAADQAKLEIATQIVEERAAQGSTTEMPFGPPGEPSGVATQGQGWQPPPGGQQLIDQWAQ